MWNRTLTDAPEITFTKTYSDKTNKKNILSIIKNALGGRVLKGKLLLVDF